MTIYKYGLFDKIGVVELPSRAKILSVGYDPEGHLCLWALVNPANRLVRHTFHLVFTGEEFDPAGFAYHGTVVKSPLVHHIYSRIT